MEFWQTIVATSTGGALAAAAAFASQWTLARIAHRNDVDKTVQGKLEDVYMSAQKVNDRVDHIISSVAAMYTQGQGAPDDMALPSAEFSHMAMLVLYYFPELLTSFASYSEKYDLLSGNIGQLFAVILQPSPGTSVSTPVSLQGLFEMVNTCAKGVRTARGVLLDDAAKIARQLVSR